MTIPPIIHFIWIGSPLPAWARSNIEEWQRLHPKWGTVVWDETLLQPLRNQAWYDDAAFYVHGHAVNQFRADLARYEILRRQGGFYADVDTRPLRPIDDALYGRSEFAVAEDMSWVGNTYLASEPDSPVMNAIIDRLPEHIASLEKVTAAGVASGPQYMTPIWYEHNAWYDERTELWFPYSWRDVKQGREQSVKIPKNAYAVHAWQHVRDLTRGRRG